MFQLFVSLLPGKTSGDLQELNRANKQLLEYIKLNLSSMATIHNDNKKNKGWCAAVSAVHANMYKKGGGDNRNIQYMDPWAVRSAWLS